LNALTQIAADTLSLALERYDVGALSRYWPAVNGIENSNYFVCTSRGEYVLTVLEQPPAAGEAYVALLDALQDYGLPVPCPLVTRENTRFTEVGGKQALLQHRLPGSHVHNPTQTHLEAVGRTIARIHLATREVAEALPRYPRHVEWLQATAEQVTPYLAYSAANLLEDTLEALTSLLNRHDVQDLPGGAIHGDLFRDNVLFAGGTLCGVLDFHHAARGIWLYDVCVAANDWCCEAQGLLDQERTMALLRGYASVRPLTRSELWFFPLFALYAATAFWLSRLQGAIRARQGQPVRQKNPDEFQRIVAQHQAHPFYIDERLLGDC
jgi:homoserine kinase type II